MNRQYTIPCAAALLAASLAPVGAHAACPEVAHFGDRDAPNRLTLHGPGGERHFHFPQVGVLHYRMGPNNTGLEVRLPSLMGGGRESYIWPRHAATYKGGTGEWPVYGAALLMPTTFGCFELPPDDYATSRIRITEWSDPAQGDGHVAATIERTNAEGLGYTARIVTDEVQVLTDRPVEGDLVMRDDFSGEDKRISPRTGFFLYDPGRATLKMKLFAEGDTAILDIPSFDPEKRVIGVPGMTDAKVYIVHAFSEDGVEIEWRRLPVNADIDPTTITSVSAAREVGSFGGHIRSEHGPTTLPVLKPVPLD